MIQAKRRVAAIYEESFQTWGSILKSLATKEFSKDSLMKIVVDYDKCTGSGECVVICPQKAFSLAKGKALLDRDKCDLDGICIPACPNQAISYSEDDE